MVVAPVSGLLSDRYPAGILGAIGMAIGFAGLVCLAFLPAAPVAFAIVCRLSICGLGFGMFFSPNSRQVRGAAHAARAAAAGAMFSTIGGPGQTLGAPAVARSEERTSEHQSLIRVSYAVFCLQKKHQYISPAS